MRLLPERHGHDHRGPAAARTPAHARAGARRARAQPVPLRHASGDPGRRAARRAAQRGGHGLMRAAGDALSRAALRAASGVLLVLREVPPPAPPSPGQPPAVPADPGEGPEILLAVWDDGSVTGFAGHVDL